eukprot:5742050-Prymnesium_polylepis.1
MGQSAEKLVKISVTSLSTTSVTSLTSCTGAAKRYIELVTAASVVRETRPPPADVHAASAATSAPSSSVFPLEREKATWPTFCASM